jgi:hypothetical protein
MDSNDLKLFALFYIKEHDDLSDKDKIKFMNFVEGANDDEILSLLYTGQMPGDEIYRIREADGEAFRIEESSAVALATAGISARSLYKTSKSDTPKEEKPWGATTITLGASAASSLALALAHKINKKTMKQLSGKCEKEKGMAKKACHNKIKKDSIRAEKVALNSMKIKCRKTKNPETCIKNIDKRIAELQKKIDAIKVF